MPRIPNYSPVPDVSPQFAPAPQLRISMPPAAFGVNIAEQIQRLGATEEQVGGELSQRALAMQELRNQAELDDLNTQFLQRTAPIHAQFSALQGKAAYEGLMPYGNQLDEIRKDVQSRASSPRVTRLFESATRNQIARDLFNGAGHAGQQLKVYQDAAITGKIDASAHQAGLYPEDDAGFQQRVDQTTADVRDREIARGLKPDDAVAKEVSRLWRERLVSLGRTDPYRATTLLKNNTDKIRRDDYDHIDKALIYQRNTTGARNISAGIFNGKNLRLGEDQIPIELAKRAIGGFESGDRYDVTTDSKTRLGRALGRYQVMEGELQGQLKEAGLPPMSPAEFLKDHEAQDKLFSTVFGNLMEKYGSFNEAASRWFTGKSVADARASGVKDVLGTNVDKYLANVNAILAKNVPLAKLVDVGNRTATDLAPSDPLLPEYAQQHITQDHNRIKALEKDNIQQAQDAVRDGIMGNFTGGQVPKNIEELRAIPQVQQAIESGHLTSKELIELPAQLNRYRSSIQHTDLELYNRLKGMANNPDQIEQFISPETQQFILGNEKISQADQKELLNLQQQRRVKAQADANVAQAWGQVMHQVPEEIREDKGQKNLFLGALQTQLQLYQQVHGTPMKGQELQDTAQRLIQNQMTRGRTEITPTGFGGRTFSLLNVFRSGTGPIYAATPSTAEYNEIKQQIVKDKGFEPTDEIINQVYRAQLYQKLYGTK